MTMPRPDPVAADDAQFWSYLSAGELRVQCCAECGTYRHPPRPMCATCGSIAADWVLSDGCGEVWARTVIQPPTLPAFTERVPYAAVVVRLDEGVFMVSNVVDREHDAVDVGMSVEAVITEVEPGLFLPLFRTR